MDTTDRHVDLRQVNGNSRPKLGSWPPQWHLLPQSSHCPWNVTWTLPRVG